MANANAPFGLKPLNLNGTTWSGQGKLINIPSTEGTGVFIGDPIVPNGAVDAFGVPVWVLATAGTGIIGGSFLGNANGPAGSGITLLQSSPIYHLPSTNGYGFVCDDPDVLYTVQEDSVGGAIAVANAGYSNGELVAGTGNVNTGMSGWMLQSSTVASGNATYQVKVLGLTRGPDNAIGAYARWNIFINLPALQPGTVGL